MNIDFLSPMMIKDGNDGNKLIFMNFSDGKAYKLGIFNRLGVGTEIILVEVDNEMSEKYFKDFEDHKSDMVPEIPLDQISKVLNTEKDLTRQNEKHLFRREF